MEQARVPADNYRRFYIVILHRSEYSSLVTLDELKNHIEDQKEYNRSLRDDPTLCSCESLYAKVFTLKQYADQRRSTDLTRFSFCPDCGKRIDWKSLAEEPRPP